MSPLLKKLIIGIGILVVVLFVYMMLSGGEPAGTAVTDPMLTEQSERILSNTNKIRALRTDGSLFDMVEFSSLTDTRVALPNVSTGRTNPFAPVN